MNINTLPTYVQAWLQAVPFPVEICAETFLREAEEWDAEARLAAMVRGDDDAMVSMCKSRAAAMRAAARLMEGVPA